MSRCTLALVAGFLVLGWADIGNAKQRLDAAELLKKADAPHEAFSEGVIRLRVVVNEKDKKPALAALQLFVKGTDKSLLVFREGKQEGRKILTQGDRVFLLVPGGTRPIAVSKTQRLLGAAAFGDIARMRFAEEYDGKLRPEEEKVADLDGETACRVLDLVAKRKGAGYPTAVDVDRKGRRARAPAPPFPPLREGGEGRLVHELRPQGPDRDDVDPRPPPGRRRERDRPHLRTVPAAAVGLRHLHSRGSDRGALRRGYSRTKMFFAAQISLSCFGQTVTLTSPRCALRSSSMVVRDWPMPPPIDSGISSFRIAWWYGSFRKSSLAR